MTYELSVIAPCYNEEGNVQELTSRLLKILEYKSIRGQVVLVDDGSRDATGEIIDQLAAEHAAVKAVHHPVNRGIEAGWSSGVEAADGEYVCFMDADLQNQPEDVPRLYRELRLTNADMAQGYRSSVGRLKNSRYILSKGLNWILNTAFRMRLRDNKSGFVLASRETMRNVLRHRYQYKYFQTYIAISASSKGYSIREIETLFESRHVGESFIDGMPLRLIANVLKDTVKAFVEFRVNVKQENIAAEYVAEVDPARCDPPLELWRRCLLSAFFRTMPLHKWMITRRAQRYYSELKRSQWLAPEQMLEMQARKLARLVDHAYKHVAYYRERMDELGLTPGDIRGVEDLAKLPLLDKATVREYLYFDLLSDNHDKRRILRVNTSGSTGEPFVCFADQHQLEIRLASTMRAMEWTGYRFGDRQTRLWHQTLGMSRGQRIRERIDAWFHRRMFVPAFEMSHQNIGQVIEKIRRHKPVLIDGYAESLNLLAGYLKENEVEGFDLKGIMSSAQVLPENSREVIERGFGCGVFDKYGAREFSGIAYECDAHDGHHVAAESYIVEILCNGRPAEPGEMGEVVITDLNNFCMPMIRYRIGDLAVAMDQDVPCACGRGLPRIGKIEGRVQAIIFAKNGRFLPGTFFAHFFKDYEYMIRQYQVVQEEPGEILLKVIKAARFSDEGFAEVLDKLREFLGDETVVAVEFVEEIPLVRTGKHQGSISKVAVDFQAVDHEARADVRRN